MGNNMDEPGKHYTKYISETEKSGYYMISLIIEIYVYKLVDIECRMVIAWG